MALLTADAVPLIKSLQPVLQPGADQAQGNLANALGKLRNRANASADASGRVRGTYGDEALTRASGTATRDINDSIYGALGTSSMKELLAQRDFEKRMALAKEIGDKMRPGLAQEILGGLSQGTSALSTGKGIYDSLGQGKPSGGSSPLSIGQYSDPSSYSTYDYTRDPRFSQPVSYDPYGGY